VEAIAIATANGARFLGRIDTLGTVEAGKLADLVVVKGDPLADIALLRDPARIALVVKDGEIAARRLSPEPLR
jgi:imidazolonepropionase-like amidohydrolase